MKEHFELFTNCPGPGNPTAFVVRDRRNGCWIGGVGANFYRPWVFPLYTPRGLTVIQEFAYDHPFHNGVFVGQHPVEVDGRVGNFWAMPPRRSFDDAIWTNVGRMDTASVPSQNLSAEGYTIEFASVWRDEDEVPLLDERRIARFHTYDNAHAVDVTSIKTAAYGNALFHKSKYGSIGVRVEPRLLPPLSGVVIADRGRRGTAAMVDTDRDSEYVAYETTVAGHTYGLLLHILDSGVRGPWFVRDYGMAMYNPTLNREIPVAKDESWTVSLRVVAYDGPMTEARAAVWCRM